MPRRFKLAKCAAAIMFGGVLTQLGPCAVIAGQTALTAGAGEFITDDGDFLGLLNVCGIPDVVVVDDMGATSGILNTEDDLFFGCPVTTVGP
jgi:hypothetical protein